jgi:hypothetical protein
MPDRPLTREASKLLHGSCRHVDSDSKLVVVNAEGIVSVPRPADRFERQALTTWGKLCFAVKP